MRAPDGFWVARSVNKDSLYCGFKLDGIKLLLGNDFVDIYRMANQKTTSIEIFKCKDVPNKRTAGE
jgi:hypothetical protein